MSKRVVTGALLIAGVCLLIWFGGWVLASACVLCLCLALSEEYKALTAAGHRPVAWPTWLMMILGVPLVLLFGTRVILAIIMFTCLITLICVVFRDEPRLEDVLMSILPMVSVTLPCMCIIYVSMIQPLPLQRTMMCLLIAIPVVGDTFAYYVGSYVKGRKLCPAVSPNKTVSGAIGGMAGSLMAAVLVGFIATSVTGPEVHVLLPQWYTYLILGIVGGIASQMGDLFASLIKRHCGVKDFSSLFPGHGGMMDRLDSIMFMSIAIFCYRILL